MKKFIGKELEKLSTTITVDQFFELSNAENSLIILQVPLADYSLTDIARIVESNSAKIMSLFVLPIAEGTSLLVCIKLNIQDLSMVMMGLERFNYDILYYYMKDGTITDTHKERLDELLFYLDM